MSTPHALRARAQEHRSHAFRARIVAGKCEDLGLDASSVLARARRAERMAKQAERTARKLEEQT
jgi:hypothetical protein